MKDAHYARGEILYQQHSYAHAEKEFRRYLASEPDDPAGHIMLAAVLLAQSNFRQANKELKKALQLDPESDTAFYFLSVAQYHQLQIKEARKSIMEALRLEPYEARYYGHLADLEVQALKWQATVDAAEQGLAVDPRDIGCLNTRARALVVLNKYGEADDGLDEALRLEPENSYTHANKGWIALRRGNVDQATDFFKEALRLDPNNTWAKEGVVESLKSRNKLYHLILLCTIRAGELGGHWRTWIIVSSLIFPPIRILLIFYALLLGFTNVTFDLILRLDPYGRRILTPEEKKRNNGSVALFVAIISVFGITMYTQDHLVGQTLVEVKLARKLLADNNMEEAVKVLRGLLKRVSEKISEGRTDQARLLLEELKRECQQYKNIPAQLRLATYLLSGELEKSDEGSISDFAEAEKIATDLGDTGNVFLCVAGQATSFAHMKKYDEALVEFERAHKLLQSLGGDKSGAAPFLKEYERVLRRSKKPEKADEIKAERKALE